MFRDITREDKNRLIEIAAKGGAFKEGEAEGFLGSMLDDFYETELGEGHKMLALEDSKGNIQAWSNFAPSSHAEGIWDVWWIGVDINSHRSGFGTKLLSNIAEKVKAADGRVIIIETSSAESLGKARNFYPKLGYERCGEIPNFYGAGDHKRIFAKQLQNWNPTGMPLAPPGTA